MTGSDRRKQIVDQIRNSTTPVAESFGGGI